MKLVVAIIQPQQLPAIKDALKASEFENMTCTNILGTIPNVEEHHKFRGVGQEISLFQKVRVEIAVNDESLQRLVDAISQGGRASGGFGKIFVTNLADCITLATGKSGPGEI
ncbi:MAG: transcriptional regulator [Planctomycetes bacterium]|nr:transcriptional regulator [Planctomycetota bacterium]